jgi:hypothetical protein
LFPRSASGSVRRADRAGCLIGFSHKGREVSAIKKAYEAPKVTVLGQFPALTLNGSLDKIGSSPDFLTALIPQLDGSIVPD